MDKKELLKEHKRLIRVLRSGTPAQREAEAKIQEKEMKEYEDEDKEKPEEMLRKSMQKLNEEDD